MLDPALLRNRLDDVVGRLARRGFEFPRARYEQLEAERKALQTRTQELQAQRNARSRAIGQAKAAGQDTAPLLAEVAGLGEQLQASETALAALQQQLQDLAATLPNLPAAEVPEGRSEADNVELKRCGEPPQFDFKPRDHVELGERNGWLDADTAARMSGARFTILRGGLARLHRALSQFMLDLHVAEHGYLECNVPVLVHDHSLFGTGQLPKFEEDLFAIQGEERRYLIPTSEVPLTNMVRERIVDASELPLRMTAHSMCFRPRLSPWPRYPRHDPPAPVQRRTGQHCRGADSEAELSADALRRDRAGEARPTAGTAVHRVMDCRHPHPRLEVWLPSQATRREILLLQLRRFPGAADAGALAQPGNRQAGAGAHPQRFRGGGRPGPGGGDGKWPERRRNDHHSRRIAPLHGRPVGPGLTPQRARAAARVPRRPPPPAAGRIDGGRPGAGLPGLQWPAGAAPRQWALTATAATAAGGEVPG